MPTKSLGRPKEGRDARQRDIVAQTRPRLVRSRAQKIVVDDAPYITLYQQDLQLAIRQDVQGFNVAPNSRSTFDFSKMSKS